jgi:ATP synthase protein I
VCKVKFLVCCKLDTQRVLLECLNGYISIVGREAWNLRHLILLLSVPFALAIPPIVGWFLGGWMDEFFGTSPYVAYFLLVAGSIAGFREVYRLIRRYSNEL